MSEQQDSVGVGCQTTTHTLKAEVDGSVKGKVIADDDDELREIKDEEMNQQPDPEFELDELDSSLSGPPGLFESETGADLELSVSIPSKSRSDDEEWVPRHGHRQRKNPPQRQYNLRQSRTAIERYRPIRSAPSRRGGTGGSSQTIAGLRAELSAAKLDLERVREENGALLAVQEELFDQLAIKERAIAESTSHDFALSLAREWMAKLVGGEGKRVEALATIFDLIKDGMHDKKSLDRLFERLVLQTQSQSL